MSLTPQDIDRLAHLARLGLPPVPSEVMLMHLNSFFAIVEQMRAVNTDDVEPLTHPVSAIRDIQLRLRDDLASEPNNRDANMQNAREKQDGLFLVPKVIE
jgi:aspartyl-tRNA(Asn)/glutamyl-tRNA(Gln) amidotransferase subunit C